MHSNLCKKLIPILLLTLLLSALLLLHRSEMRRLDIIFDQSGGTLQIHASVPCGGSADVIRAYQTEENVCFLFLPAHTADYPIRAGGALSAEDSARIEALRPGETAALDGGRTLTLLTGSDIPSVFLTLRHGLAALSEDQSVSDTGVFRLVGSDGRLLCQERMEQIRGRGNTSWELDRKPFNLRLQSAVRLPGMDTESDQYALVSSYDQTFLRNRISQELAKTLGEVYVCGFPVQVYIDGSFEGVYELRARITPDYLGIRASAQDAVRLAAAAGRLRQSDTGVYTDDWTRSVTGKWWDFKEDVRTAAENGYLIEADSALHYAESASGFILAGGAYFVSKSPEYLSAAAYAYISDYFQQAEDALNANVGTDDYGSIAAYFDLRSVIVKYLIEEVSMNLDSATSSQYFYKRDGDDVLHAGPVWDYDEAYGSEKIRNGIDFSDPETFAAREAPDHFKWWQLFYYNNAFFRDAAAVYENELYPWLTGTLLRTLPDWEAALRKSAVMDDLRWKRSGGANAAACEVFYHKECAYLQDFLAARAEFLFQEWSGD